jgi:hypothetical protein
VLAVAGVDVLNKRLMRGLHIIASMAITILRGCTNYVRSSKMAGSYSRTASGRIAVEGVTDSGFVLA